MATYAIGDARGNFQALSALLENIRFHRTHDTLWFTGNLVGPGLDSLAVAVLGDQDLRVLAAAEGVNASTSDGLFDDVLSARS